MSADTWTAVGGCVTALTAIVVAIYAALQFSAARRLREDQARPYVVVYMEQSEADASHVDLIIKNFGLTAAMNVRIEFDPEPERCNPSGQGTEALNFPEVFPHLVPGQEWRCYWDTGFRRAKSDLPDRHMATVTYDGPSGKRYDDEIYVLDWDVIRQRSSITIYGMHHAATALREISKTTKGWEGGKLTVWTRDGDAREARRQEHRAEREARERSDQDGP